MKKLNREILQLCAAFLLLANWSSCTTEDQLSAPTAHVEATFSLKSNSAMDGTITIREAYLKLDRIQAAGNPQGTNITEIVHQVPPEEPPFRLSQADSSEIRFTLPSRAYHSLEFLLFPAPDNYELMFEEVPLADEPEPADDDNDGTAETPGSGDENETDNDNGSTDDESDDSDDGSTGEGDDGEDDDGHGSGDGENDGAQDNDDEDDNESSGDDDEDDSEDAGDDEDDDSEDSGDDDDDDSGQEDKDDDQKGKDEGKNKDKGKDKKSDDDDDDDDEGDDDDDDDSGGDKDDGRSAGDKTARVVNLDHFFQHARPALVVTGTCEINGRLLNIIFAASGLEKLSVVARQNDSFTIHLDSHNTAEITFDPAIWFEGVTPADIEGAQAQTYQQLEVIFIHRDFNRHLYDLLVPRLEPSADLTFAGKNR